MLSVLYGEFDDDAGPVIVHQHPTEYVKQWS